LGVDHGVLFMKDISKTFSGVKALTNVNFDLRPGEIHALVGENGAGKSTLMKILTGVYEMDTGEIFLDGRRVQIRNVHEARSLGISIIFQELSQIPQLTVAQNIFLGKELQRAFGIVNERAMIRQTKTLLDAYQIRLNPTTPVAQLRTAERQLAEIAKALSLGSRIVIMDEPTSSLTLDEAENLFRMVKALSNQGVGIIYISHRMDEIGKLADRVTVLRDGKRVGTFEAKEISIDEIVRLMVGRDLLDVDRKQVKPQFKLPEGQPPLLDVRGLSRAGVLHDISFSLKQGEILGLAGLIGSGRSEVARALIGIDPFDTGEIRINGQVLGVSSPGAALRAGMVLVPEDRHLQGLIMRHSVEQNIVLPLIRQNSRWGIVNARACRRIALEAVQQLRIVPPDVTKIVRFLSGGNQQKVVLGKWLSGKPKILILDEPTLGVDVGSKAEIHQLIRNLTESGIGILLISSDMPEIIALSHRMLVMYDGRIQGEFLQEEVTEEKIMAKIMEKILAKGRKSLHDFGTEQNH